MLPGGNTLEAPREQVFSDWDPAGRLPSLDLSFLLCSTAQRGAILNVMTALPALKISILEPWEGLPQKSARHREERRREGSGEPWWRPQ